MKISELLGSVRTANLREAPEQHKPKHHGSRLPHAPRAASIDDEPGDDGEQDGGESSELDSAVEKFRQHGSQFGPDLYSFSSIDYGDEWSARNASSLAQKLGGVDLAGLDSAIDDMRSASGRDGGMTFIILNGRSGEVVSAGFGMDAISDGIVMDTLEDDQQGIVDRINAANVKYMNAGGGGDDETSRNFQIREHILALLKYDDQSVKSDRAPLDWGLKGPTADTLKIMAADARARREARKLKKQSGPGREKR
jgi:hypothetical protein